ncbi:hypothetical protein KOW79_016755 [Hemibagrus wyckioides]|uniref:Uncharacterized protein n=1 Tax=Hemibagrus wyckioides TaxID=337641 RepID=A0A9D3SD07_9TELE|nr:hypothetical protein KOW79_016755 [Hemibagrus wyckioides]
MSQNYMLSDRVECFPRLHFVFTVKHSEGEEEKEEKREREWECNPIPGLTHCRQLFSKDDLFDCYITELKNYKQATTSSAGLEFIIKAVSEPLGESI